MEIWNVSWVFFLNTVYNGRAYATVLRPSVTLCIVAKRCALEQKLLLTAYEKSIGIPKWMTPIPWSLFGGLTKVMSTIASHSPLNISETVRDRGLVSKGSYM